MARAHAGGPTPVVSALAGGDQGGWQTPRRKSTAADTSSSSGNSVSVSSKSAVQPGRPANGG
eukprot:5074942-Alexandrium_andersonii.AAC.2